MTAATTRTADGSRIPSADQAGITDDDTLAAALYGTACHQVLPALDDLRRLQGLLAQRAARLLGGLQDLSLAEQVLRDRPEMVSSEVPLTDDKGRLLDGLTQAEADCLLRLRQLERTVLAYDMLTDWDASIRKRGRTVGAAEHSVRMHASAAVDRYYKEGRNMDQVRDGGL